MSGPGTVEGFSRSLAFLVAIDNYQSVPKLQTPVSDARALADLLGSQHGFAVEMLLDASATLDGLRTFLSQLPGRIREDDRILFYFAGHGITTESTEGPVGYVLPQDAGRDTTDRYLPMLELNAALSKLPCRHFLAILDCCFAGALRWSSTRHLALAPENLHRERYRWFVEDPAWHAIASSAHDQKALDRVLGFDLGTRGVGEAHSPFASALLDGLRGNADRAAPGKQGDGVITVTELYLHLVDSLLPSEDHNFRQTPLLWPLKKDDKGQFVFLVPGCKLDLPPAPFLDAAQNPWKALSSYDEADAELFYGRTRARDQLLKRVSGESPERLIAVTGPSGIGKSSLVKAGLLPHLPSGAYRSVVMRPNVPGPGAFESLASALRAADGASLASPQAAHLRENGSALASWINAQNDPRCILLVVDQAEELITANDGTDLLEDFSRMIAQALGDTAHERLRVVLTMRSEFEPHFAQTRLAPYWPKARYHVPPMLQDDLRRIVECPAAAKVLRLENSELVETLVNEVANMPGALPVLSFALSQMYRNHLSRHAGDRCITWDDYSSLGAGVIGSLRARANQVIHEGDETYRLVARRLLERFVSIEAGEIGRRRVPEWEFDSEDKDQRAISSRILKRLDEELLIVRDAVDGTTYFELAHDALILGWPELLSWVLQDLSWLRDLRRLTASADEYDAASHKPSAPVWADAVQVEVVKSLVAIEPKVLNGREAIFAKASLKRAGRNTAVRWSAIAALVSFSVIATIGFVVARQQTERAVEGEKNAKLGRDQALLNQSRLLQKEVSNRTAGGDPATAMLVGLEGLPDRSSPNEEQRERPYLASLEAAVFKAAFENREIPNMIRRTDLTAFAVDAAGTRLVTGAVDGTVEAWDLLDRSRLPITAKTQGPTKAVSLSDVGDLAVAASNVWSFDGERPTVLDLANKQLVRPVAKAEYPIASVGVSPKGDYFVLGFDTIAAGLLVPTATPSKGVLLPGQFDGVAEIAFSQEADRFVTRADMDMVPRLWSSAGAQIAALKGHTHRVNSVAFSGDGSFLATGAEDGVVKLWRPQTGEPITTIDLPQRGKVVVRASPDSKSLFAGLSSGDLFRLDLGEGRSRWKLVSVLKLTGGINSIEFRDGDLLLGSDDGVLSEYSTVKNVTRMLTSCPEGPAISTRQLGRSTAIFLACANSSRSYDFKIIDTASTVLKEKILFDEQMRVDSVEFSGDGSRVLFGSEDRAARIVDLASTKIEAEFGEKTGPIQSARYYGDGRHVVLSSAMGGSQLWEAAGEPRHLKTFDQSPELLPEKMVTASAASPDMRYVLNAQTGRDGVSLVSTDVSTGKVVDRVPLGQVSFDPSVAHEVRHVAFSKDGSLVAVATSWIQLPSRTDLNLFRFDAGKMVHIPDLGRSSLGKAVSLKFTPSGQVLLMSETEVSMLSINGDGSRLDATVSLAIDTARYGDAAVSPNGKRIYVASGDTIRVFDTQTQKQIGTYRGHGGYVTSVDVSPSGDRLVSGSADGSVRLWQAFPTTQSLVDYVKESLKTCLTERQREDLFLSSSMPKWCSASTN